MNDYMYLFMQFSLACVERQILAKLWINNIKMNPTKSWSILPRTEIHPMSRLTAHIWKLLPFVLELPSQNSQSLPQEKHFSSGRWDPSKSKDILTYFSRTHLIWVRSSRAAQIENIQHAIRNIKHMYRNIRHIIISETHLKFCPKM